MRLLVEGDSVLVLYLSCGDPWLPGVICSKTGPASFTVDLIDRRRVRRRLDQVSKNTSTNVIDELSTTTEMNNDLPILVLNFPIDEPPPSDDPPRTS